MSMEQIADKDQLNIVCQVPAISFPSNSLFQAYRRPYGELTPHKTMHL